MKYLTPIYISFLMLFGGMLGGYSPLIYILFTGCTCIIAVIALLLPNKTLPVLLGPSAVYGLAFFVSYLANLDIFPENIVVLLLIFSSFCVLILFARLDRDKTLDAIYTAGWIWLAGWLIFSLFGWKEHKNVVSVWPIFICIAILAKGKPWPLILPFVAIPFLVRGRAGIIGLAAALAIYVIYNHRYKISLKQIVLFGSLFLIFVGGLLFWRFGTVTERIAYWDQAIHAWIDHDIWFGLGPQGITVREVIKNVGWNPFKFIPSKIGSNYLAYLLSSEPYLEFQPFAHNLIVQLITEFGLVGFSLIIASVIWIIKIRPRGRWQLAIIAGILTYSMFDHPLYNHGTLILFTIVIASLQPMTAENQVETNKKIIPAQEGRPAIPAVASSEF